MTLQVRHFFITAVALIWCGFSSCASHRQPVPPGTIPEPRPVTSQEEAYGHEVLAGLSREYELDYSDPRLDRITKVIDRLTRAAHADQAPWHVYLFRAPEVKNAAATRGNHVFVWSGLLDFVTTDEELAVILSHELAHVLAGHTDPDPNEEVRKLLIQIGAIAAGVAVSVAATPHIGIDLGDLASGATQQIGAGIFSNPYSKDLELEADHIGLYLMAEAGYDPASAVRFWDRVQDNPDFSGGFQFFSTHPAAADRLAHLQELLPDAEARYKPGLGAGARASSSSSALSDYYESKYGSGAGKAPAADSAPRDSTTAGDSFDWRATQGSASSVRTPDPQSTAPRPPQRDSKYTYWRVKGWKALLRENPADSARAIGEFRQGASLVGQITNGRWLEIDSPDHGFISLADLETAPPKRGR